MYNFASDSTFRDVVARLARGPASFADVWPLIGPALISGRSPSIPEYDKLHLLIASDVQERHAANAALTAPYVHDGSPQIAGPSGIGEESKVTASTLPESGVSVPDPITNPELGPTSGESPEHQNSEEEQPESGSADEAVGHQEEETAKT